jgi:predicted site-specific integrase-resolvase
MLISAKEVSEDIFFGKVSAATIRRWARNHKIPVCQCSQGCQMLFDEKEMRRFAKTSRFGIKSKSEESA